MQKHLILFYFILLQISVIAQLSDLNDEFDRVCSIQNWQDLDVTEGWNAPQIESMDISQSHPGHFSLMPYTVGWYQDRRAPLIFKLISGDFVYTTKVTVSDRAAVGLPSSDYSLGGMMIRRPKSLTTGSVDWVPGDENYLFLSTGYASTGHPSCSGCPAPHFEVKSTLNGNSNLQISSIDTNTVTIRMARIGGAFLVLFQYPGDTFQVHERFWRPDFPDTVQVGLVSYTDWSKVVTYSVPDHNQFTLSEDLDPDPSNNPFLPFQPDALARFDFVRFDSVFVPQELDGLVLTDENEVSDEQLLSFLGYPSEAASPQFEGHIWTGAIDDDFRNALNYNKQTLPGPLDSILIPDCNCPGLGFPQISNDTIFVGKIYLENSATLQIQAGAVLIANVTGTNEGPLLSNFGVIENNGHIIFRNASTEQVLNFGEINNRSGSVFRIEN